MGNYLTDLTESVPFEAAKSLIPSTVCPYLYYNLTPYIHTLAGNGWFDWVKKGGDLSGRKQPDAGDFSRKDVNRLYPNEVLVRCPNPSATVVAGLGPGPGRALAARILHVQGNCPFQHAPGDVLRMPGRDDQESVLDYNGLFPDILSRAVTGRPPERGHGEHRLMVTTSRIISPCRYHRRGKVYAKDFLPDRFCPHVFALLYPRVLAVMYGAEVESRITVRHPGTDARLTVVIHKDHFLGPGPRSLVHRVKKGFEALFHPVDLLDYRIIITVVENEDPRCTLRQGLRYRVNLRDDRYLCPASFHVLYPYLLLRAAGRRVSWGGAGQDDRVPCPDCIGTVYSLN